MWPDGDRYEGEFKEAIQTGTAPLSMRMEIAMKVSGKATATMGKVLFFMRMEFAMKVSGKEAWSMAKVYTLSKMDIAKSVSMTWASRSGAKSWPLMFKRFLSVCKAKR